MLSVEDIADLGVTLSRAGFRIATHQFLSTQKLIESMWEYRSTPEHLVRLPSFLSPIFCTKPEEQARFEAIYLDWLTKRRGIQQAQPFLPTAIPTPPKDLRYWWKWIGLGFLSLVLLFGICWGWNAWKPRQVVGTVLSGTTPLDGVHVHFGETSSITGSDGRFSVRFRLNQLPGSLTLEKNGFVPASRPFGEELLSSPNWFYLDQAVVSTQIDLGLIDLQKTPDEPMTAASPLEPIVLKDSDGSGLETQVSQIAHINLHDVIKVPPFWERIIWINVGLAIIPLGVGLLWILFRKRKQLGLQRMASRTPPALREVHLEQGTQHLFPSFQFRRLAQTMRSRRLVQSMELDTFRTIQATALRGGIFSPVYGALEEPGYIALIDRMSVADHHARLALQMTADLLRTDVLLEPLEFDRDPTLLRHVEYGRRPLKQGDAPIVNAEAIQVASLDALQAQYPRRRVLLFAEATTCFDRLSGNPEPWLETMAGWDERFLITAEPIEEWSKATWVLERKGFKVIPLSPLGFTLLTDLLQSSLYAKPDRSGHSPFYQRTPEQWLERYEPKPGIVGRLCSELQQSLGHDGFLWLCACAAYPEIHWGLTLRLGVGLFKDQEQLESVLPKLSRLIWFREGFMPDWLRAALLKRLEPPALERVRTTLTTILSSVADGELQTLSLQIAREEDKSNRWFWQKKPDLRELARESPTSSPLRDYVFLAVLSGQSLNNLSPVAPSALMRAIFPEGQRALGLQPWVMTVFFLFLTIVVAWVRTPIVQIFGNPYAAIKIVTHDNEFLILCEAFAVVRAKLSSGSVEGTSQVSFVSESDPYREIYDAGLSGPFTHLEPDGFAPLFVTPDGKVYLAGKENVIREVNRPTSGSITDLAALEEPPTLAIADSTGIAFVSYKDEQPSGPFRQISIEQPNAVDLRHSRAQGLLLAAGSKTQGTTLWTMAYDPPRVVLTHRSDSINTVALSQDGSLLADGAEDGTVQVWSPLSAVGLASLKEGRNAIQDLTFTAQGDILAAIDSEGTIRLWDTSSFKLLHTIQSDSGPHGKLVINTEALKDSDSFHLLSIGEKSIAQVWKIPRRPIISKGRSVALLVGNNYSNDNRGLQGPMADTQLLAPVLERLGYQVFRRTEISQNQIVKDFTSLTRQLSAADTLIVFLSGLGTVDSAGTFAFVGSSSGAFNEATNSVRGDQLAEFFRTIPAQQALLVVDASFSRSLAKLPPYKGDKSEQPRVRTILSSYTTDHPMDSPTGGPFAKALASTLQTLTHSTSGASLVKEVARKMSPIEKNQVPSYEPFSAAGHTGGDFQFAVPETVPKPIVPEVDVEIERAAPQLAQGLQGFAFYSSEAMAGFKHTDRSTDALPQRGDIVKALRFVNVRSGYSLYDKTKQTWVRQPVKAVLSPGDQVRVLGRKELGTSVVWIEFELLNPYNDSKTPIPPLPSPNPLSTMPSGDSPSVNQAEKLGAIRTPRTGYAYYGYSQQYNFRQVSGGYQDDPGIGDVIEATVQVHARKGYIRLSPAGRWINQDAIGLIEPGDQLKVLDVYRPVSSVIWIRYELVKRGARADTGLLKSVIPPPTQAVSSGNENPVGQSAPLAPLSLQAR